MPDQQRVDNVPEHVVLAAHNPECFGCGPDNPAGLHLEVVRIGDEFVTELSFDRRHAGAPGLVHGGALASACDDLFGFVLYGVGELAVTRSLQMEYQAPVPLDRPHRLSARLDRREGRKLFLSARGTTSDGTPAFSATSLFLTVEFAHFARYGGLAGAPEDRASLTGSRSARRDS